MEMIFTEIFCILAAKELGLSSIQWQDIIKTINTSRKEIFEFIMPKHKSTTDFSKFVKEFTQKYMNKKTFKVIVK
jgi:hypothetical protein